MEILGVVGVLALSVACAVVGVRLLRVAARTRELPELSMGIAFVASGALGFPLLVSSQIVGMKTPGTLSHLLSAFGTLFTYAGYIGLAVGTWRIYRARAVWPRIAVGVATAIVVVAAATCFVVRDPTPGGVREIAVWIGIGVGIATFGWSAVESFLVYGPMRKRVRVGLLEAAVADRVRLWGVGSGAACGMAAYGLVTRLAIGPVVPDVHRVLSSALGLVAAVAIWLAFFPPAAYRRRLARSA